MRYLSIAQPIIQRDDISAVKKVLKSGNLAQGPEVAKFESEFSDLVDGRSCVAVNSGTSGLHLALLALGIGPGDEVIVPAVSWSTTYYTVDQIGCILKFVDIDPLTLNIDISKIEEAINKKTKAILAVNLLGNPADWDSLNELAEKYNLVLL